MSFGDARLDASLDRWLTTDPRDVPEPPECHGECDNHAWHVCAFCEAEIPHDVEGWIFDDIEVAEVFAKDGSWDNNRLVHVTCMTDEMETA